MESVDVRELRTNPSAAVEAAAAGQTVMVTRHGRPVAQLCPIGSSPLERLRAAGLVRAPRRHVADLPEPLVGLNLSTTLVEQRAGTRF